MAFPNRRIGDTSESDPIEFVDLQTDPFLMVKEFDDNGKVLIGNDRYIGYCADLIKEVAAEVSDGNL